MFQALIMAIAPHCAGLSHDRKFEKHGWTMSFHGRPVKRLTYIGNPKAIRASFLTDLQSRRAVFASCLFASFPG
jgi:hypothetical protein